MARLNYTKYGFENTYPFVDLHHIITYHSINTQEMLLDLVVKWSIPIPSTTNISITYHWKVVEN